MNLSSIGQVLRQNGVLLGSIAVTALALWGIIYSFGGTNNLAALAISGIVVLLGALLVFTTLMNVSGLSDKTQALGLPDGSVRAVIAIALVGLFAILASSVLQPSGRISTTGMQEADIATFRLLNPSAKDILIITTSKPDATTKTFSLSFTPSTTQPLDDFPKQMLTLLGTLMTALTAFYFGGRTAAGSADGNTSRAAPELAGIENSPTMLSGVGVPTSGPICLTLTGNNLNSIRGVRLATDAKPGLELEAVSVLSNASRVTCVFAARAEFEADGVWNVTVVDDIGRTSTKSGLLTLRKAAVEQPTPPKSAPTASSATPSPAPSSQLEFSIAGTGLEGSKSVTLTMEGKQPVIGSLVGEATSSKITFTVAAIPLTTGSWKVHISDGTAEIQVEEPLVIT